MNDTKQSGKPRKPSNPLEWKKVSTFLGVVGSLFYVLAITYGVGYSSAFYGELDIQIFRHTAPTEFLMLWSDQPGAMISFAIFGLALLVVAGLYRLWKAIPEKLLATANVLAGIKRVTVLSLYRMTRTVVLFSHTVMRLVVLFLSIIMRMVVYITVGVPYLIFYPAVLLPYMILSFLHICIRGVHRFLCEVYDTLLEDLGRKPKQVRVDYALMEEMVRSSKLVPKEYEEFGAARLAKYHADTRVKIKELHNLFGRLGERPPKTQSSETETELKFLIDEKQKEKSRFLSCFILIILAIIAMYMGSSLHGSVKGKSAEKILENWETSERANSWVIDVWNYLPIKFGYEKSIEKYTEFPFVHVTFPSRETPLTNMRLVGATLNTVILYGREKQRVIVPRSSLESLEIMETEDEKAPLMPEKPGRDAVSAELVKQLKNLGEVIQSEKEILDQLKGAIENVDQKISAYSVDTTRLTNFEQRINAKIYAQDTKIEKHDERSQEQLNKFQQEINEQDAKLDMHIGNTPHSPEANPRQVESTFDNQPTPTSSPDIEDSPPAVDEKPTDTDEAPPEPADEPVGTDVSS